jgi:hypothetical protein
MSGMPIDEGKTFARMTATKSSRGPMISNPVAAIPNASGVWLKAYQTREVTSVTGQIQPGAHADFPRAPSRPSDNCPSRAFPRRLARLSAHGGQRQPFQWFTIWR